MLFRRYFTYIITNPTRTVLYTGVTNNLPRRLTEHYTNCGNRATFAGRYNCFLLLHYETFPTASDAIAREKELKGWKRIRKEELIRTYNPESKFLNEELMAWPPVAEKE